jgi:flagellar protein FlaG
MATPIQDIKINPGLRLTDPAFPSKSTRNNVEFVNRVGEYQKRMEELSQAIRETLNVQDVKLNFSVDRSTGQVVIRIIDGESGEVIREIPPEELLSLAREMEELTGILYNQEI